MKSYTLPNLLSVYSFDSEQRVQLRHVPVAQVGTLASIIIVSHNSRQHLERCLSSVMHTVGLDCEVIVVDNASTDGSADFVVEHYPWVNLVRSTKNVGFAMANNKGVEMAQGRYIVALNPDTEVTPGWLEALLTPLTPLAAHSSKGAPVGITTARILMMDKQHRVNTCGNDMHYTGITVCRGLGKKADDRSFSEPTDVSAVSGACFAMRRSLWGELGGLDPTFFTYMEDTDISARTRLAGYRCVYVPDAIVYHNYTSRFSARKLYYLERNRLIMLLKCYHRRTLVLMLPALILVEMVAWAYAVKSGLGHVRAKLAAYRWIVRHRAQIGRKRIQTQRTRHASDADLLGTTTGYLDMTQLAGPALGSIADKTLNPLLRFWHSVVRNAA